MCAASFFLVSFLHRSPPLLQHHKARVSDYGRGGSPPRFRADSAPARWNIPLVQSGVRSRQRQLRPIKEECLPSRHWGRQKSLSGEELRDADTPLLLQSRLATATPEKAPSNPEASYPRADPSTPHGGGIRRIVSCIQCSLFLGSLVVVPCFWSAGLSWSSVIVRGWPGRS